MMQAPRTTGEGFSANGEYVVREAQFVTRDGSKLAGVLSFQHVGRYTYRVTDVRCFELPDLELKEISQEDSVWFDEEGLNAALRLVHRSHNIVYVESPLSTVDTSVVNGEHHARMTRGERQHRGAPNMAQVLSMCRDLTRSEETRPVKPQGQLSKVFPDASSHWIAVALTLTQH